MKTRWKVGIAVVGVAAAGLVATAYWAGSEPDDYGLFTAPVVRDTVETTIVSTGKVDAMVTVDVGSQVTGQVQELYASFNSIVREGQILAQLDPRNFQTQVRNAEANLASARSRIETARADRANADANLASSQANRESAEMELRQAETNLNRAQALHADNLVPDTEVENVTLQLQSARARLTQQEAALQQAEAQIVSRDASIRQAEAALEQAEAALEEAQLNLGYTTIRSPVDGVVISREVDVGQTVSASTSAPTLFVIANDLSRMQVEASVDEADIGLLGRNDRVDFAVDAYPDDTFIGRIEQIRLKPTTTQNVVTYGVIITFENPDLRLKPGMTANLTITVDRKDNVLAVPNAALRYEPPDSLLARVAPGSVSEVSPQNEGGFDPSWSEPPSTTGASAAPPGSDESPETPAMPGQLWDTGQMIQFDSPPPAPPRPGRVWVLADSGAIEPRDLTVGITDGSRTEIVSGNLREGEMVLISDSSSGSETEEDSEDARRQFFMMRGGVRR